MWPYSVFSKSSPSASSCSGWIATFGSRTMFAGPSPLPKNRQPASSRRWLILIRAAASFMQEPPWALKCVADGA